MFGYSHLPFSTSDTAYFNGEIFNFILHVGINQAPQLYIDQQITFVLNIEQDKIIIL